MKVGIDAISAYFPKIKLTLSGEWAQKRYKVFCSSSPEELAQKVNVGIGISTIRIPDIHEDSATLAANAARRAIERGNIDPREIGQILVGTETSVDQSKSIASYVLGMLEEYFKLKIEGCSCPEFKFACAGASYALQYALNTIRSGENIKKYSLVIATDIACYDLNSSGESTQGAGAVAFLVCENPRILAMEAKLTCTHTVCERDFFRPNWRHTAVVDGKYSVNLYLDLVEWSFRKYKERLMAKYPERPFYKNVDYLVSHIPYPKMVEYCAARVYPILFEEDKESSLMNHYKTSPDIKQAEVAIRKDPYFKNRYLEKTKDSLWASKHVGNIYSASLFLGLMSLIKNKYQNLKVNDRFVFCSYGSGATSLVFSGLLQEGWQEVCTFDEIDEKTLEKGQELTISQYEYLHQHLSKVDFSELLENQILKSICEPDDEFGFYRFGNEKFNFGYRFYKYFEPKYNKES